MIKKYSWIDNLKPINGEKIAKKIKWSWFKGVPIINLNIDIEGSKKISVYWFWLFKNGKVVPTTF